VDAGLGDLHLLRDTDSQGIDVALFYAYSERSNSTTALRASD
jgi:hypothetical protein